MATKSLSTEDLRKLLHYCPDTGIFTWVRTLKKGLVAGTPHKSGFLRVNLRGESYFMHRLAWLWVYGEFPRTTLLHINGVKTDNRICNLTADGKVGVLLDYIRSRLTYSPTEGEFYWVSDGSKLNTSLTGRGYVKTSVLGKIHYIHRLAWLWVHGRWPDYEIDHINRVKTDNRLDNLREVNSSENCQNRLVDGPSGLPGVRMGKSGSWETSIAFRGRQVRVTGFATPEEASEMHIELKKRLHDTYTHLETGYGAKP